jgi:hypothetical protein
VTVSNLFKDERYPPGSRRRGGCRTQRRGPRDARSICVAERRRLGGQFEDQVDRRLRRAPQVGKSGFLRHLAQALFARLHTAGLEPRLTDRVALLAEFDCDFARRSRTCTGIERFQPG